MVVLVQESWCEASRSPAVTGGSAIGLSATGACGQCLVVPVAINTALFRSGKRGECPLPVTGKNSHSKQKVGTINTAIPLLKKIKAPDSYLERCVK